MNKIATPDISPMHEISLATFNMGGHEYQPHWPEVAGHLAARKIGIAVIQEAVYLPNRELYKGGQNSAELMNVHANYPYVASAIERRWHDRVHDEPREEGLAVFSKWPILEQRIHWLRRDPRDEHERFMQLVKLDLRGRAFWLANIHNSISDPPPNFAIAHTEEVFQVLHAFSEETGHFPVVAGDFNLEDPLAVAGRMGDGFSMSRQTARKQKVKGYITNPQARGERGLVDRGIDHIGAPPGWGLCDVRISGILSDHSMVSATARLPAEDLGLAA